MFSILKKIIQKGEGWVMVNNSKKKKQQHILPQYDLMLQCGICWPIYMWHVPPCRLVCFQGIRQKRAGLFICFEYVDDLCLIHLLRPTLLATPGGQSAKWYRASKVASWAIWLIGHVTVKCVTRWPSWCGLLWSGKTSQSALFISCLHVISRL